MDTPYAQPTKETKQLPALLLTRPEAAAQLAISLRTLDLHVSLGNLPVVKIGKSARFRDSSLELFIESNESRFKPKRRAARKEVEA